jgi:succinate dehydrogenase / fumarate reductase iron-sulfur subunit
MKLTLEIWRQKDANDKGHFETYEVDNVSSHMSFLEMLDVLNQELIEKGEEPVAFDHDCREAICGTCGFVINGVAHGHMKRNTVCQLHMRTFKDGDHLVLEPWRAKAFPLVRDLIVDRSAFERIQRAGGYISARTGSAPDANSILIPKEQAEAALDFAECIGCGACVASCPNGAAMLFVGARIAHLGFLPQGQPERVERAKAMVAAMEQEGFGACTNYTSCEATCPKGVSIVGIAKMNKDYFSAKLFSGGNLGGKD